MLGTIVLVFMLQQSHFMQKITQNVTLCTVHTQKVRNVYDYCEVLLFFSTKQHIYITTSIYLLQKALI